MSNPKNEILVLDEQEVLRTGVTYTDQHYLESSGNKNYFEDVIDQMMIEKFNEKIRQKIYVLPKNKQRRAVLALLQHHQPKRKLFVEIEKNYNELGKTEYIKFLIRIFVPFVTVAEVDVKKYGEIMTPLKLVKDMISKLPKHVWSNPNLKWADVCNGTGPFLVFVIYRLMVGLANWEPDEEKRYKHIVENMIYAGELQPTNMFLWMYLIDPLDEFVLNIYTGSFLKEEFDYHMKNVWGVEKFDVVVGNPPYMDHSKSKGKLGSFPLWIKFLNKSFELIKDGGYLVYVHPSLWRQEGDKKCSVLRNSNILFLNINNEKEGKKTFGAETRFDWYVTQKSSYKGITNIIDEEGSSFVINLNEWTFIPNKMFGEFYKLLPIKSEEKVEILHSYSVYETRKKHMNKEKNDLYKYPCVYMCSKNGDITFYYSSVKKDFFIPKVIIPPGRIISVSAFGDENGEYGLTQFAWGIKCNKEEIPFIVKSLNSKKFKDLAYACSVSKLEYNKNIIKTFKKDFWKEFI